MAMRIGQNIENVRREIKKNGNVMRANRIARDGIAAIFAGIGKFNEEGVVTEATAEWKRLMSHFATTQEELDRLCGKEKNFNASDWGMVCLAYIAGDSTCTSTTTDTTGTRRSMLVDPDRRMLENLDAEVKDISKFKIAGALFAKALNELDTEKSDLDTEKADSENLSNTRSSETDTTNDGD